MAHATVDISVISLEGSRQNALLNIPLLWMILRDIANAVQFDHVVLAQTVEYPPHDDRARDT